MTNAHHLARRAEYERHVGRRVGNRTVISFQPSSRPKGLGPTYTVECPLGHRAKVDARRVTQGLQPPACGKCGGSRHDAATSDDAFYRCNLCGGQCWRDGRRPHWCEVLAIDSIAGARRVAPMEAGPW